MKIEFGGQVAIVTGAGSGIGRAVSLALAKAGATVLAVDIAADKAQQTAEMACECGGKAAALAADVSREADVAAYAAHARDAYGRIDIFMNNAGWQGAIASVVDYPTEQFDKIMAINVRGVFLGLKYVLPAMVAQGRGAVVNTASLAAHIGTRNMAPYAASKHAVLGLTKSVALEVARKGVRVNAVCPGPVDTDMLVAIEAAQKPGNAQSLREQRAASIPDGRYAAPEEIANLMLYLASEHASHITGQGIQINGGSHG
jgi:3alpha(or 20beta)-hydroxysteroid dehydrogenase